ncbi:hypothetical protein PNEG_00469 [Pneumocystis murina B123]|uniref:Ketopantoate reductase C-terminal domain-containing protein n=1 Tax=Pneumocystis murina (strain B123) TaxID=1069680 RepID=M7NWD3_PNEMU|nr:hypothetical protein PNEG_00469 [Pneumocystis murina B123]EMR11451.1 hypothetical protein PNEG_00469 [Pneumocystis murina B123]
MEQLGQSIQPVETDGYRSSEGTMNKVSSISNSPIHILSVGSNAISAFFSWRLQSSNACKVTLVWRNHFDAVSSYGISFRSNIYDSERFKPHRVVQTIEEAKTPHCPFDYIFVCIKALPDIYDIATIIEPVVTSSHTCIIINTTNAIGIENQLIERFPKNLVLSLVSEATFTQLNVADYEHSGSKNVWIGFIQPNLILPEETQRDMIESLTLTLEAGNVNCRSSSNILQQQWEKMIGPISFHPISVLFDEPSHSVLLENQNAKKLISNLFDELLQIAEAQNCSFDTVFKSKVMNTMTSDTTQSVMYQDYIARRPMEIQVFLTNPLEIANKYNIIVPRLETIHALMHNLNNRNHLHRQSPSASAILPRQLSPKSLAKEQRKHHLIHEPNGYNISSGDRHYRRGSPRQLIRHDSLEGLEEFADIAMYGDMIHVSNTEDADAIDHQDHNCINNIDESYNHIQGRRKGTTYDSMSLKEKELALFKREKLLREKEVLEHKKNMARFPRSHASDGYSTRSYGYDDDDDYTDYHISSNVPANIPPMNSDNFDMMSMTFRRHRKNTNKVSTSNMRNTFENKNDMYNDYATWEWRQRSHSRSQPYNTMDVSLIGTCDHIQNSLMLGYSSNRYGTVDSKTLVNSRTNSLTTAKSDEMRDSSTYGPPQSNRSTIHHSTVNGAPLTRHAHHMSHQYLSTMNPGNIPPGVPQRTPSAPLTSARHMPSRSMIIHSHPSHGPMKNGMNMNPHRSLTGSASASTASNGNGCASGSGSGHSSTSSFERGPMI